MPERHGPDPTPAPPRYRYVSKPHPGGKSQSSFGSLGLGPSPNECCLDQHLDYLVFWCSKLLCQCWLLFSPGATSREKEGTSAERTGRQVLSSAWLGWRA